jgi:uncharacterized protein YkwD
MLSDHRKVLRLGLWSLAVFLRLSAIAAEPASSPDWFAMAGSEFRQRSEPRQRIDLNSINSRLLSAAVHHETNLRRERHRLPPLKYDMRAEEAARMQAEAMAQGRFVGHINPLDASRRDLADRVRLAGLRPAFAAENVAQAFGRHYKSGRPFTVEKAGNEVVYRYAPSGEAIPMHTYLSFAADLLDGWMDSPGHRKNILHQRPHFHGCSASPGRDATGMEIFHCVQVFFTPPIRNR